MEIVQGKSFEELWKNTVSKCEHQQVHNLLINGEIKYSDVNSPFIKRNMEIAKLFQESTTPKELKFSHGSYINMYGDGYKFIIDELNRKDDSNRACFSLMNMENIINSGDDPIPSFLIQQFGLSKDNEILYLSSYYRALEVKNFLPINLAEMAFAAEKIKNEKPSIKTIELNIFVFTAHIIENFYCLKKRRIDTMTGAELTKLVMKKDYGKIVELLLEKKQNEESGIVLSGIILLKEALEADEVLSEHRKKILVELCCDVIIKMEKLRYLRKSTSNYKDNLKEPSQELTDSIQNLMDEFEEVANDD